MIINHQDPPPRLIEEYEFHFIDGTGWPIVVDKEAGDTVEFDEANAIIIKLVERPHPTNPEATIPAEEHTFFVSRIVSIKKTIREYTPHTFEQKLEWQNTLKSILDNMPESTVKH